MNPTQYVYALIISIITLCVANPIYLEVSEANRLPCSHHEDHIQYLCSFSGGEEKVKVTIDSNRESHSWLSRANGQFVQEFRTDERKIIEKYIRLITHNGHATYPTLLENLDSVRVECIQRMHGHWIHKKIGFLHVVDVLSILSIGIIALTAYGIALVGGGDKLSNVPTSSIRAVRATASKPWI